MTTNWASPRDVEQAAEQWSDSQVACRTYGHNWRPRTVTHRPGVYTVRQRCSRCFLPRTQQMNESGYLLSGWHIDYTNTNYLLQGMGRVGVDGRAVLRIVNLRSAAIVEEPDD